MATKAAQRTEEPAEKREDSGDSPLLDTADAAVKNLVKRGKERGYITYDELNKALPPEQVSSEQIEDTMASISEMGINLIETEEGEEPAEGTPAEAEAEPRQGGNISEDELGRTDDPVRMYLREMGSASNCCRARARSPSPSASRPAERR